MEPPRRSSRDRPAKRFADRFVTGSLSSTPGTPRSAKRPRTDSSSGESGWTQVNSPVTGALKVTLKRDKKNRPSTSTPVDTKTESSESQEEGVETLFLRTRTAERVLASQPGHDVAATIGVWKPTDDLLLATSVLNGRSLEEVQAGIRFSTSFSLTDIETRWKALLYDERIALLSKQAIADLPTDFRSFVQSRSLFSDKEDLILSTARLPNVANIRDAPRVEQFGKLLSTHPFAFHPSRTPHRLMHRWYALRHYRQLPEQQESLTEIADTTPFHAFNTSKPYSLSDIEDELDGEDVELKSETIPEAEATVAIVRQRELAISRRCRHASIRKLEAEVQALQQIADEFSQIPPAPQFDVESLACLRGRLVRYLMRFREITIGRRTIDNVVDVDVSLEGPCQSISRRQATIRFRAPAEFAITNDSSHRSMFVDGRTLLPLCTTTIEHESLIEMGVLRFVFITNREFVQRTKNSATTMMLVA